MRRLVLLFVSLLCAFIGIWITKAKNPSNRPDSYSGGLTETEFWWNDVAAEEVSSNWQLSAGVPENYIPVPGKPGLYMVVDEDGYITGYRQGTRNEDGTWDWEDVNPDIPENYEAVPGLENVYKVTADDGSVRYFRYIRNKDDTYAFVEVDARGNVLGEKVPTGAEIPENYERVTRNQYAVKNNNGVVVGYKERIPDSTSPSGFTWVNIDEPNTSQLDLPEVGFDLTTDITGTGDVTGGIREMAGFTGSGTADAVSAVPTLMPSSDLTGSTASAQTGTGGFVFSQPEVHIDISQTVIPVSGSVSSSGSSQQLNPGGYSFSGDITGSTLNVPTLPPSGNLPDTPSSVTGTGSSNIPSVTVENTGYYQATEVSYSQKQEGDWLVTYAVTTEKTYDAQGNLIGTKEGQPVEVARQQTVSASASGSPASTLSDEYARISGLLASANGSYNAAVPNELVVLLNTDRGREGTAALSFNGNSPAYQIALCRAAMMALTSSSSRDLPSYGTLSAMCGKYGVSTSSPSENMLIVSASSADAIHATLQASSGKDARMSSSYTEIAIAIVQLNGRYYIDEVFIK